MARNKLPVQKTQGRLDRRARPYTVTQTINAGEELLIDLTTNDRTQDDVPYRNLYVSENDNLAALEVYLNFEDQARYPMRPSTFIDETGLSIKRVRIKNTSGVNNTEVTVALTNQTKLINVMRVLAQQGADPQ